MGLLAPPSQKYRQIGFWLETPTAGLTQMSLSIRPEDLTRTEPSRLSVQQTLGGAWPDSFDRGLSTIVLSGHTGWRGSLLGSGEDDFYALRNTVFVAWHQGRADAISLGRNPDGVSLYFMDNLDNIRALVAPRSFQLRRSRARPLLYQYQIQLTVLDDTDAPDSIIDDITSALSDPLRWLAGVTGLGNIAGQLDYWIGQAQSVLGAAYSAASSLVATGSELLSSVASTAESLAGEFDIGTAPLLSAAQLFSVGASNAFAALANDDTLPTMERIPVMALSSNFADAACTMANAFNSQISYITLDPLLGASSCSSTSGGEPWSNYVTSGTNPFDDLIVAAAPPVILSAPASSALATLSADPLTLVGQTSLITSAMATAAAGVTLP